jgi:hypothetical protein
MNPHQMTPQRITEAVAQLSPETLSECADIRERVRRDKLARSAWKKPNYDNCREGEPGHEYARGEGCNEGPSSPMGAWWGQP